MTVLKTHVRPGGYYDSILLMQLQVALADLPGVLDAGAVMATPENRALLEASGLLPSEEVEAGPPDLLIVVKADSEAAADLALSRVDALLARSGGDGGDEYRPRTLKSALRQLPAASWALVSVPGRFAARVAGEALDHGLHVFLYSDNVAIEDEVALKARGVATGRLVMGPDCGTASINGVGFGFANRVRRGAIGLVGASGTGLQAICSHLHALGAGVSHAIGTGGRDLDARVGARTALQGIDLLARDPGTLVIVLVSKPPEPEVARKVLAAARACGKPVVVHFLGMAPPARTIGSLHFASSLADAARMAADLAASTRSSRPPAAQQGTGSGASSGHLRGLFSGGTLAAEALHALRLFIGPLRSNLKAEGVLPLSSAARSEEHTILDLGGDEFRVGRLHPMIDNDLRLRRLAQEAADPDVGLVLLDVVLGDGAHPDPASELGPAIAEAKRRRDLEFVALVIGTDEDPQDLSAQAAALEAAGARVFTELGDAVTCVLERLGPWHSGDESRIGLESLSAPVAAVNLGLEIFADSLGEQGAVVVHVDWRPPAGGDDRLAAILERMRR